MDTGRHSFREVRAYAPGRVNLLGEHTDYTGGLALPLAINRGLTATARRRSDGMIEIHSASQSVPYRFPASGSPQIVPMRWVNYILGVIAEFWTKADMSEGLLLEVDGDLPPGAGLASSAALTVACAKAINRLYTCDVDDRELARMCQRAEQNYAGVKCGIMDQAVAAMSKPDHALFLDCYTMETRLVPMPDVAVFVIHSGVKHDLAESKYNQRVSECASVLRKTEGKGRLGELVPEDLKALESKLSGKLKMRAEHVVTENQRVRDGVTLLEKGELQEFGKLMYESHASLRDRYEVSCPELDAIVERVRSVAYGAKMTGAGFGGAVVALIDRKRETEVENSMANASGLYVCSAFRGR